MSRKPDQLVTRETVEDLDREVVRWWTGSMDTGKGSEKADCSAGRGRGGPEGGQQALRLGRAAAASDYCGENHGPGRTDCMEERRPCPGRPADRRRSDRRQTDQSAPGGGAAGKGSAGRLRGRASLRRAHRALHEPPSPDRGAFHRRRNGRGGPADGADPAAGENAEPAGHAGGGLPAPWRRSRRIWSAS